MPSHTREIVATGMSTAQLLRIGYRAAEGLEWTIPYINDTTIVALTKQTWGRYANEVAIVCEEGKVTVTSKMIHGELMDLPGRTKKDVNTFIEAFEKAKQEPVNEEYVNTRIAAAKKQSEKSAEQEIKEVEELDNVMKLSSGNMNATWLIMGANVLVFILMVIDGAGILDPHPLVHVKWGSNFSFLTLTGDWWRLFTSTYIHFGIIHLAMNMYALYMAGVYLEPMLGKTRYVTAYTACGILASVASLWWHKEGVNSAGASGAVFGLYGLFLALLLTNLIPARVRQSLLQTTAIFVGYNLLYGMKGGIDNAAHIGGLVSGFIIGLLYTWTIKEEQKERRTGWAGPLVLLLAVIIAYFYLRQNSLLDYENPPPPQESERVVERFPDDTVFDEKIYQFNQMNGRVMAIYQYHAMPHDHLKDSIRKVSIPYLDSCKKYLDETKDMRVSANARQKTRLLLQYVDERRKEMDLMLLVINKGQTDSLMQELESIRNNAKDLFETAVNLPL